MSAEKVKKEIVDLTVQSEKIISLDAGTMNLIVGKQVGSEAEFTSMRNMFLPLDKDQISMAEISNIDYVESDDSIFLVGQDAFNFSNIFGKEVKRPMSKGLVSSTEVDGLDVLALIIEKLVGKTTNGKCMYCIPAPSVDMDNNIVYHEAIFKRILNNLGYYAESMNEAHAIIYSQCQNEQFTGLAFSWGAGMCNVNLSYRSVPVVSFSVARSGDWIDSECAKSLGTIPNRITKIKENDIDLMNYSIGGKKESRVRECISYYYKEAIRYSLDQIKTKLSQSADNLDLPESLTVIVSGGTSMATGFIPLFSEILKEYENDLPFKIKAIKHADDPMTAVAEGLLIKAMSKFKKASVS